MISNLDHEDNVVRNIAKEIVRDCSQDGAQISLDDAFYLVNLKILLPAYEFTEGRVTDRNLTQKVVDECVSDFLKDKPWMSTLKLQVLSEASTIDKDRLKSEAVEEVRRRAKTLLEEVLEVDPSEKEKLFKKLVQFTVIFSGLGNPNSTTVLKEAQAALQSVFKQTEVDRFVSLSEAKKEEQLLELTKIVSGIRLFNKDCRRGGDSIDDLPLLLMQAAQITRERLNVTLDSLEKRIQSMNAACDAAFSLSRKRIRVESDVHLKLPDNYDLSDFEEMIRILYLNREHEQLVRNVAGAVDEATASVNALIDKFREILISLHDIVRYRAAVPTFQVYPLFIQLSDLWDEMTSEGAFLNEANSLIVKFSSFNKFLKALPLEVALNSSEAAVGDFKPTVTINLNGIDLPSGVTFIPLEKMSGEPQFSGFCAWTLGATGSVLVPGDPNLGFLQYRNRIYSFSAPPAAVTWANRPDHFICEVFKAARRYLELVKPLKLYEDLYSIKSNLLVKAEEVKIVLVNREVQTELHPIPHNKDKDYTFSVWQMKNRAMQLSRILKCQTKSQQTPGHSNFRGSIGIQVNPDRTVGTETMRDASCNSHLIRSYLKGLRGHVEDRFEALQFRIPVDGQ